MISTLAQFDKVDAGFLRDGIVLLCAVMGAVYLGICLVEKFRAKKAGHTILSPDPLRFAEVEKLATRAELEAIRRDIDADIGGLRQAFDEGERKSHAEIVAIHSRINTVAENTSAMKGRLDEIAGSLHELVKRAMK